MNFGCKHKPNPCLTPEQCMGRTQWEFNKVCQLPTPTPKQNPIDGFIEGMKERQHNLLEMRDKLYTEPGAATADELANVCTELLCVLAYAIALCEVAKKGHI